ncbi:MAG: acyltransferase domain-containing protein, partial [Syntrophaceae bacterium]
MPSLHFETPNPNIDFENSPFYVNTRLREWESNGTPRIAGVSAFGIGGTNVHAIVQEAPETMVSGPSRERQLLLLSGRTLQALDSNCANLAGHLKRNPGLNLADVAYTLQKGRRAFAHRRAMVCRDVGEAVQSLENLGPGKVFTSRGASVHHDVVFLFSGQASEYVNMGHELYQREPLYRDIIDRCAEILRPLLMLDLRDILYPSARNSEVAVKIFNRQSLTQSALFTVEYALARLWMAWGIRPAAMVGHSLGEYAAACLSGVFSLEDAVTLVAARGRLMEELSEGSMCAVFLPEEQLRPLLSPQLSIALINGPSLCVVSGETDAVMHMTNRLSDQGIEHRRLRTSHAFHSAMTEPILERYSQELDRVTFGVPKIPFVSNVTGTWAKADEVRSPEYW